MKKVLFLTLLLIGMLHARENPFSPLHMISIQDSEPKIQAPSKIEKQPVIIKETLKPKPIVKKQTISKTIPIAKTIPVVKVKKRTIIKKKSKHNPCAKKKVIKRAKNKRVKTKLIYTNKFTKIKLHKNKIAIKTKDTLLKEFTLKHPNRIVFDFERFDPIKTTTKKIYSKYVKNFKIGHHGYFYRVIFTLSKNRNYKLVKKPYGYAISIL